MPRIAGTGLLALPGRSALLEPLVVVLALILLVVGLEIGKQRPGFLRGRGWAWSVYLASMAALLVIAVSLTHDWLYPSKAFRDFAIRVGETALVVGFPVLFWMSLREKNRIGVIATWSYGGLSGRSIPSMTGLCWWVFAVLWYATLFPGAPQAAKSIGLLVSAAFAMLIVSTETLAQPRFLVPVCLREEPGRLEDWWARHERRHSKRKRAAGGRPTHRLIVPPLVTVILEPNKQGSWQAWSTDLDDFKAEAPNLEALDAVVYQRIQERFTNPNRDAPRSLCLQYLCEDLGKETWTSTARRKDVLFDVSALDGGGYTAQSVDEVCERYQGKTLEAVIRTVAGSGIRNARYTWQRNVELRAGGSISA